MSASLVGSEMCIRDRGSVGVGMRNGASAGAMGRGSWMAGWVCAAGAAVSYTHLTLPTICRV
eukprot:15304700-Alexandrium_andersonii.AAC.1